MNDENKNVIGMSRWQLYFNIVGASIGNVLEWFDFGIYAFFAVVIAKVIFGSSSISAILLVFLAYGIGFVLRPFGSIYFGWLGDKAGRKNALLITFWIMGAGTILTGLVPSYASIGFAAPVLITIARILQGFGAGGEWGGAGVYLTELGGKNRRGFFASLQQEFILGSVLIGLVVALFITVQPASWVDSVGWRLPFIIGGVLLLPLAWYIRSRMTETEAFEKIKEEKKVVRNPVVKAFTTDIRGTLIILFGTAGVTGLFYTLVSFMPTYILDYTSLGHLSAFYVPIVIEVTMMVFIPIFGFLSDKFKVRKKLFWIGTILLTIFVFPVYLIIGTGNLLATYLISIVIGLINGVGAGVLVSFIAEAFATNDRYSGYIAYNFAASYFGGFSPFIATYLIAVLHTGLAPGYWGLAVGIMSSIVLYFAKETGHIEDLPEEVSLYATRAN